MSYQTGSATGPDDLMAQLNTFLTGTPGWTSELFTTTNDRAIWSKAGVSAKMFASWDTANIGLAMIQQSASPIDQPLLSQGGAEFTNNTVTNTRHCNAMPGPYPSYHFFEDDNYIHVVVEKESGVYRHFGFGQMLKLGQWTGGMYAYCQFWNQTTSDIDNPNSANHVTVLDGRNTNNATRGCGVHAVGLPDQLAGSKYLRQTTSQGTNDDDGQRVGNMFPSGWADGQNVHFMAAQASDLNNFKPLMPIPIYQWAFTPAPDNGRLIGYPPDKRTINMFGLNVAEELNIGGDIWVVFPITRKGNQGLSFNQEQSYNFGLAYKKVTT